MMEFAIGRASTAENHANSTEYHLVQNSYRNAIKKGKSDLEMVSLLLSSCHSTGESTETTQTSSSFVSHSLWSRWTGQRTSVRRGRSRQPVRFRWHFWDALFLLNGADSYSDILTQACQTSILARTLLCIFKLVQQLNPSDTTFFPRLQSVRSLEASRVSKGTRWGTGRTGL